MSGSQDPEQTSDPVSELVIVSSHSLQSIHGPIKPLTAPQPKKLAKVKIIYSFKGWARMLPEGMAPRLVVLSGRISPVLLPFDYGTHAMKWKENDRKMTKNRSFLFQISTTMYSSSKPCKNSSFLHYNQSKCIYFSNRKWFISLNSLEVTVRTYFSVCLYLLKWKIKFTPIMHIYCVILEFRNVAIKGSLSFLLSPCLDY